MGKVILVIFLSVSPIILFAQESVNESVEKETKPTVNEEINSNSKEKEQANKEEDKKEPKEEPVVEAKKESEKNVNIKSDNKNSIEIKFGALYGGKKYHPVFGILYERSLTPNWSIGGSIQRATLSTEIKGGNFLSTKRIDASLIPLDFLVSYHFRAGESFRPFIRGYIGPTLLHVQARKESFNETYFHLGLGVGFKYYFSENFFATTEVSGNLFMGRELIRANNKTFAQIGLGIAF